MNCLEKKRKREKDVKKAEGRWWEEREGFENLKWDGSRSSSFDNGDDRKQQS